MKHSLRLFPANSVKSRRKCTLGEKIKPARRPLRKAGVTLVVLTGLVLSANVAFATDYVWDGGGADNNWGTGANWNPDGAPAPSSTNSLHFAGTTRLTSNCNYTAFDDFQNILFDAGAGSFTITGNSLDIFGKIENNSTNLQTFSIASFSMNSSTGSELDATAGDLTIALTGSGNNIFNNGNTINVYGNNNKTLTLATGTIMNGSGGFFIHDVTNVVINSAQTYTGTTAIDAGRLTTASTIGNNTGGVFLGNGGTGTINGIAGQPMYANTSAGLFISAGGVTLANNITTNKADTGSGLGSGTRIIGGTNTTGTATYSGTITLNGGAVLSAATGGTVAYTGVIQNGSDTGNISRAVTVSGPGTVVLSNANTYTGATTVNAGTLSLTGSLVSPTLAVGGGTFSYDKAGTNTQGFTTTNINVGSSTIRNSVPTDTLNLGALSRTVGGTVNFTNTGPINTTTANTATSILGGWATVGGNTWAVSAATGGGGAGAISGFASYTASVAGTTAPGSTADVDFQASNTTAWNTQTINSLRFNNSSTSATQGLYIATGQTLTITSGGILAATIGGTTNIGNQGGVTTAPTSFLQGAAGKDLVVINNSSNTLRLYSIIQDNGSASGLTIAGTTGTTVIAGANTYTGTTTLNGSVTAVENSSAFGPTGTLVLNGGSIRSSSTGSPTITIGNAVTIAADTTISTGGSTNPFTFSGPTTISGGTRTITQSNTTGTYIFGGAIGDGGNGYGLTKAGTGALTVSGPNTYSGITSVTAGTLLVNNTTGSGTGTGAVTVNNSGSVLGGSGKITGAVVINTGTTLAPGATGGNSTAVFTTGALTLAGTYRIDLQGATAGTNYDQTKTTGAVTLTGSSLAFNSVNSAALSVGQKFYILLNGTASADTGIFTGAAQGSTVSDGFGDTFTISYTDNGDSGTLGNDVSLTVLTSVPEPATWLGGLLALGSLGYSRRRHVRRLLH